MNINSLEPCFQLFIRDLLKQKSFAPDSYCTEIGAGDEMFYKGILPGYNNNENISLFKYTESALRSFDIYRQLVQHLGGFPSLGPVLDFGSGWGRITRSLVQCLSPQLIWVSDIYSDAIGWQAETFCVNGLVSVSRPECFALKQKYSIILAGSVFSHLPDKLFKQWLSRLYDLILPNGLLAFSVHAEPLLPEGEHIGPEGIHFLTWSESASLGAEIYGMTYVTEKYVAQAIAECDHTRKIGYRLFPKALYENQDLYIVAGKDVDLTDLNLKITPIGGLSDITRRGAATEYVGWGIELDSKHQLNRAELFSNDKKLETVGVTNDNFELSRYFPGAVNTPVRWGFTVPNDLGKPDDILRFNLVSQSGAIAYCYAGTPLSASDTTKIHRT